MQLTDDADLLKAYTTRNAEDAFTELVGRHVGLVYSAALRQVHDPHLAEEVTQAVFIILARKARTMSRHATLSGWLCRVAHFVSRDALRAERRRRHRELIAVNVEAPTDQGWTQIAPMLDEIVAQLSDKDRSAIVLRFYEQKSLGEVGAALGVDADAAQKRVSRALEKLRKYFTKRGVSSTAAMLAGAISANSVSAAPAGLAQTISAGAVAKGAAAGTSTLTLVKGALKIMAWTKAQTAIVVGVAVLVATGATTVTLHNVYKYKKTEPPDDDWQFRVDGKYLESPPYRTLILPTRSGERRSRHATEGGVVFMGDGRVYELNASIADMVRMAYGMQGNANSMTMLNPDRVILDAEVVTNKFDFFSNLPNGAKTALQQEIKRQFGIVGRFETVETNVLELTVKYPNAVGLKPSVSNYGSTSEGGGQITMTRATLDDLAQGLENCSERFVINQTDLTNNFDFRIQWKAYWTNSDDSVNEHPNFNAMKAALTDQLGLDLVPTNMPIEMLVVEKVK
jgi:uncharacterized protein (TIGR03435 family)